MAQRAFVIAKQRRCSKSRYNEVFKRLQRALVSDGLSERKARDIAFHMLDWLKDLDALHRIYRRITGMTDREVCGVVTGFLVHAAHHIDAAKFLYGLGAPSDLFNIGLFRNGERKPAGD